MLLCCYYAAITVSWVGNNNNNYTISFCNYLQVNYPRMKEEAEIIKSSTHSRLRGE